jgi:curved DNA-binding protein CbpA
MVDYYEFLQISPNADFETIHRVFRFLATRFHPDHPESGNADLFHQLKTAYDVLSDPVKRGEYDLERKQQPIAYEPLSSSIDFMDDLDGELNRRVAVLAVLYQRRRTKTDMPEVSLEEIENRMGFPREYLDFTLWYLARKGYVSRGDSAQFILTVDGVDFVESQRGSVPVLNKMLTSGSESVAARTAPTAAVTGVADEAPASPPAAPARADRAPIVLPSDIGHFKDRRATTKDRRAGKGDRRGKPDGRRAND